MFVPLSSRPFSSISSPLFCFKLLLTRASTYVFAVALLGVLSFSSVAVELEGTPVAADPTSTVDAQLKSDSNFSSLQADQNPEWLNEHNAQLRELEAEHSSAPGAPAAPDAPHSPSAGPEHDWQKNVEKNLEKVFSDANADEDEFPVLVAFILVMFMFTALTILCSPLVLIGFYLALRYKARARRQRELNANIDKLLAAGRDIPLEILRGDDPKQADDQGNLAKGIRNICLGTGWFVFLVIAFGIGVAALGFIWVALGVSQVLIWHLNRTLVLHNEQQVGQQD